MSYQRLEKLKLAQTLLEHSQKIKTELFQELVLTATDDVFFMRRFRMLQNINALEEQALRKIYNFDTEDLLDYAIHGEKLIKELHVVTSRNA